MSWSQNVDTDPGKMNVCSRTYLYLDVFVHKFKNTFMDNSELSDTRISVNSACCLVIANSHRLMLYYGQWYSTS